MEDSLENLISYMEMEDDIFNESSNSSIDEQEFLKEIILQQQDANSPTNSNLSLDETSFDHQGNIDKSTILHKSKSSNSIMSSLEKSTSFFPCLLSFESESRGVHKASKKVRGPSETQGHLMAERKRRRELTQSIIQLSAIIPGLKKMDKVYILSEAVNYTKQLQKRVQELENQNKDKGVVNSATFIWKSKASNSNKNGTTTYCERNRESLLEIEARVREKDVLIRIHCEKQKDMVLKTHVLLEKLHLSVTSSSVLPFGTSFLIISIFAQIDDEHMMTMDDLVENLRKYLSETYDIY